MPSCHVIPWTLIGFLVFAVLCLTVFGRANDDTAAGPRT